MSLLVRPSRDEDVPVLAAIYAHSVMTESASWEYDPPSEDEFRRRRTAILAHPYPYLVAESDGEPVGYAYASSYRARIGYRHTVECSVYISQMQRGKGVGTALLLALIEQCRAAGFRQMLAVIGDSANLASIRLHSACGFVHVGTFRGIGEKFGRALDSVQMQRDLRLP